jgi:hypothetical protein
MVEKQSVLKIIDSVMNNREIDSIRNAILAIRDQVVDMPEDDNEYYAKLKLRCNEPLRTDEWFDGAEYFVVDTALKFDTGSYGAYWYE